MPGCASGEEAYSLAICLLEFLGDGAGPPPIKLFGTDMSDAAIEKARAGRLPGEHRADVSPERLRRFFVKVGREVPDHGRSATCASSPART